MPPGKGLAFLEEPVQLKKLTNQTPNKNNDGIKVGETSLLDPYYDQEYSSVKVGSVDKVIPTK